MLYVLFSGVADFIGKSMQITLWSTLKTFDFLCRRMTDIRQLNLHQLIYHCRLKKEFVIIQMIHVNLSDMRKASLNDLSQTPENYRLCLDIMTFKSSLSQ
jgi:hypothetical protein